MSETIRFARLGKEDINLGTGTFEVRLADGRVVTLQQVDIGELISDASISTRDVTLDSLTVTDLTVSGTTTPTGTMRVPEKADPGSPVSGEVWINSGATVLEYADDQATPTAHALVADDTTQTLTNKTLTSPALTTPVVTGAITGTYNLAGTPSLGTALDASDEDITSIDELHFANASANPTVVGRIRRNGTNILWHDGTSAKVFCLVDATQTLTNKTITALLNGTGTITIPSNTTDTLMGKATTDTMTNKTFDAQGTGNSLTNVSTSSLKTSNGGSATGNTNGAATITLNDYAFFPNIQQTAVSSGQHTVTGVQAADDSTTVGRFRFPTTADAGDTYVVRWRYVTASDDPVVWVAVHNLTGLVHGVWVSDDPTPDDVPGIAVEGCRSIRLTAQDLESFSELSAKASDAQAYIREKRLKAQHQAYRALQLLANDPAPSRWLYENCEVKNDRLAVKRKP